MIPRRDGLAARVARIECRLADIMPTTAGPLSRVERAELAELRAEYAARFPGDVDDWDEATLNDFMGYCSACDGAAARIAHLQERARSPQERAEDAALAVAIDAMDWDTLDLFMAEMASSSKGNGS